MGVIGDVSPIGGNSSSTSTFDDSSTSTSVSNSSSTVEEDLVADLESDEQISGEYFLSWTDTFFFSFRITEQRSGVQTGTWDAGA